MKVKKSPSAMDQLVDSILDEASDDTFQSVAHYSRKISRIRTILIGDEGKGRLEMETPYCLDAAVYFGPACLLSLWTGIRLVLDKVPTELVAYRPNDAAQMPARHKVSGRGDAGQEIAVSCSQVPAYEGQLKIVLYLEELEE